MKTLTLKQFLIALAVFTLLLCLAYLPKITHVGYLQDDWNTLFVTENRGPGELVFHYSIDRPLRGYFSLLEVRLFGTNLPFYIITAFLWRLVDTVVVFLLLMFVWPENWLANLLVSSLTLIYPAFHEQVNVYEYQAHLFSRMCVQISILLSLIAFSFRKWWLKSLGLVSSIMLALLSYGLMEYYVGMEVLRLALFMVLYHRTRQQTQWFKAAAFEAPFVVSAVGFLVWRLFFFESKRASVDASGMLSAYSSPVPMVLENLRDLVLNYYRLVISAFYKPLLVFGKYLDASDWVVGVLLALLAGFLMVFVCYKLLRDDNPEQKTEKGPAFPLTLILVGLAGCVGALVPVIFGGREITYTVTGDRFSYPGSVSAAILLVGLIWLLRPYWLRVSMVAVLIFFSVLTQFSNDVIFEKNGDQTRAVWWQMSWRAPQLKPTTMLTGHIYLGILDEDYTLWGPANLIYYPGNRDVVITAEVLDPTTAPLFEDGKKALAERKGIEFEKDFGNLLVLSKTENACLHLIDGQHPEYSQADDAILRQVGGLSQLGRIDVNSDYTPTPRKDLFGSEPPHDWCYYYQKAQLARQQRNWQAVATLGDEAIGVGHSPNDPMEWLVFMQAFAYTGDEHYQATLAAVTADAYSRKEACAVFQTYTTEMSETVTAAVHETLLKDVCATGK